MKFSIQKHTPTKPRTKAFWQTFSFQKKKEITTRDFAHGYKGYKDWGAWNLMAEKFAKNGFIS